MIFFFRYYVCPFYITYYHYFEYAIIMILTFNVVYYVSRVLRISLIRYEPLTITQEQKKLLHIDESGAVINKLQNCMHIYVFICRSQLQNC